MPRLSQNESGKAWEYSLASEFASVLDKPFLRCGNGRARAQRAYRLLSPTQRVRMKKAANEAVRFLRTFDRRLEQVTAVSMQADREGAQGDVRDILLHFQQGDNPIGISAKHRHVAVKHPRLSPSIDFGKDWYGRPCSQQYWSQVRPLFRELNDREINWREVPDKESRYYLPILRAFVDEVRTYAIAPKMLSYLIGRQDFYKIVKINGYISIQSFNLNGTLKWGQRLPEPSRILEFLLKSKSNTTAILAMNNGWQLSFRIHNASTQVEPSLKLDIKLTGQPSALATNLLHFG